jgi:cytochrome P450
VAEQDALVAKHGPSLTKEQIDKECPYLDAVVKETMRLTPVSGGGLRVTDKTIVVDGKQIPKKWFAMYSAYLTHANDPMTWKEDGSHMSLQDGFEPNRWLDKTTRPTTEFMPWGAGTRFCVGWVLAATEMRIFLAILARKMNAFQLLTDSKTCQWKEGIVRTPKDGVVISPFVVTA